MSATIYHNPKCSKSRQTLELLRKQGINPTIIDYLKNPPTLEKLKAILAQLEFEPRDLMRKKEAIYAECGLDNSSLVKYPVLIERPIVLANNKAVIGRPPEQVFKIIQE